MFPVFFWSYARHIGLVRLKGIKLVGCSINLKDKESNEHTPRLIHHLKQIK
jgi:hypothetical protein